MTSATKDVYLTARWILTMTSPPQQGGWIRLRGPRIAEVGTGRPPTGTVDLGDVAILPGLINAHTHLEFSDVETPIGRSDDGRSDLPLHQWIGQVVQTRQVQTPESVSQAIAKGWQESREAGVRWLADITTPPRDLDVDQKLPNQPGDADSGDAEYCGLSEVIGLSEDRWTERWQQAERAINANERTGLSPHAPYSTATAAIDQCVVSSRSMKRLLAMHIAESPEERQLICDGSGSFADALMRLGAWQPGLFPWEPVADSRSAFVPLIAQLAKSWRALIVHGNDLTPHEIELISQHTNLTVVYCPRTHWFFRHNQHPVDRMLNAGVRVALGTDSRASNPDLNLWSEVQFLLNHRQDIAPSEVLAMSTVNAAEAIGRSDLGCLQVDMTPGLGTVATSAEKQSDLHRDLACNRYQPWHTPVAGINESA